MKLRQLSQLCKSMLYFKLIHIVLLLFTLFKTVCWSIYLYRNKTRPQTKFRGHEASNVYLQVYQLQVTAFIARTIILCSCLNVFETTYSPVTLVITPKKNLYWQIQKLFRHIHSYKIHIQCGSRFFLQEQIKGQANIQWLRVSNKVVTSIQRLTDIKLNFFVPEIVFSFRP